MDFSSLEWGSYKALLRPQSDQNNMKVVISDELREEESGKLGGQVAGNDIGVQTAEASFVDDESDVDEDEDCAMDEDDQEEPDKVVKTLTVSVAPKRRIRNKFPTISPHIKAGKGGRAIGQENALNSPPPTVHVALPNAPQPPINDSTGGGLGVLVGQKPLTYPPQKVNVVRSKEYAEQVQRELLLRKMQRMQGI
ncbi:hypothetical protein EON65_24450 [archaeon]|nr:MAG: hypothetical protein EON65_24450 [archaeon]